MQHLTVDFEEFERVHAEAVLMIKNAESMLARAEALIERIVAAEAARLAGGSSAATVASRPSA